MITEVFKCSNCEAIMVVDVKDIWKLGKCPRCGGELKNLDEEFENSEIIGAEDNE